MGNTNILKTFLGFYLDQDKGLDTELGPSSSESGFLSVPLHLLKMKFRLLIKGTWEVFQVQLIVQKALSFFLMSSGSVAPHIQMKRPKPKEGK